MCNSTKFSCLEEHASKRNSRWKVLTLHTCPFWHSTTYIVQLASYKLFPTTIKIYLKARKKIKNEEKYIIKVYGEDKKVKSKM